MEQGSRKRKSGKFRFAVSGSTINKLKRFLLNFIAVFLWLISLVIKLTVVRGLLLTRVCLYVGFTVARQRQWIGCLCCFISAMTRIWRSLTCSLKTPRARLVWVSTARCEAGIRAVKPRGSDATARAHAHHAKADASSSSSSSSNVITCFPPFPSKRRPAKNVGCWQLSINWMFIYNTVWRHHAMCACVLTRASWSCGRQYGTRAMNLN